MSTIMSNGQRSTLITLRLLCYIYPKTRSILFWSMSVTDGNPIPLIILHQQGQWAIFLVCTNKVKKKMQNRPHVALNKVMNNKYIKLLTRKK